MTNLTGGPTAVLLTAAVADRPVEGRGPPLVWASFRSLCADPTRVSCEREEVFKDD
jgi:hypothetical protein